MKLRQKGHSGGFLVTSHSLRTRSQRVRACRLHNYPFLNLPHTAGQRVPGNIQEPAWNCMLHSSMFIAVHSSYSQPQHCDGEDPCVPQCLSLHSLQQS